MARSVARDREDMPVGAGGGMRCSGAGPGGPEAARLRVARAVAVLGEAAEIERVGELLNAGCDETQSVIAELVQAGLSVGECRPHPEMAARVLRELPGEEHRLLHTAAAE